MCDVLENSGVTNFREYLRYKTITEFSPDYDGAIAFLKGLAKELDLPAQCVEVHPGMSVLIITWEGTDPSLKSIVLNSHMDVVPVYQEYWDCDPFEGKKMENGDIYGRGAQDMKCVGIQYIEAVRRLIQSGKKLKRTVHITFVPDEETDGVYGMQPFLKTPEFKKLNMGFGLDEGLANPTEKFKLYHGERPIWWMEIKCSGRPGHGSQFIENTAAEKLQRVLGIFLKYRDEEHTRLKAGKTLGEVNTINLVKIWGGVTTNVVPSDLFILFDIRVTPISTVEDVEKKLTEMVEEAGEGVSFKFLKEMASSTWLSCRMLPPFLQFHHNQATVAFIWIICNVHHRPTQQNLLLCNNGHSNQCSLFLHVPRGKFYGFI